VEQGSFKIGVKECGGKIDDESENDENA